MFEYRIGKNDAGQRLDKFLSKAMPGMPVPMVYRLIRQKKIKLNRKRAENGTLLKEGDTVQVFAPPRFSNREEEAPFLTAPEPVILYEDENILLLNKPSGLLVHEGDKTATGEVTLVRMLRDHLIRTGDYDPETENSFSPALANRIDRNTEGIVLAAKNAAALRALEELIRERKITKKYLCVLHGAPKENAGKLRNYLLKDEKAKTVTVFDAAHPKDAKLAETGYWVLSRGRRFSLVEAELFTGRTHQIRAQFAHIGCPLLGEGKYAKNAEDRALGYSSQALCSHYLRFEAETGFLSYLCGREFNIPDDEIGFVRDFRERLSRLS